MSPGTTYFYSVVAISPDGHRTAGTSNPVTVRTNGKFQSAIPAGRRPRRPH